MTTTTEAADTTTHRHVLTLGEDWLAVGLGGLSIALVLAGLRLPLPSFAWAGVGDLTGTGLGPLNLANVLVVGAVLGILAGGGALLQRGALGHFPVGFQVRL